MVRQYPHIATIITPGTDAVQDANGNWIPGSGEETVISKCRAESATGDGYVTGEGGTRIDYSWIVYFPKGLPKVAVGSQITVVNGAEEVLSDTVKRFSRGQLNVRVWL